VRSILGYSNLDTNAMNSSLVSKKLSFDIVIIILDMNPLNPGYLF